MTKVTAWVYTFLCSSSPTQFTRHFIRQTQQNLDGSVFLHKNPFFMSVQVMVISLGIITTWTDPFVHKDRIFMEKYGAVQVCFGKVVLLWNDWKLVMTCDTVDFFCSINHSCTASISLQHWHLISWGIGTHLEQLYQSNFPKHFMKLACSHTSVSDSSESLSSSLQHTTFVGSNWYGSISVFKVFLSLSTIYLLESVMSWVQKVQYIMAHVFCSFDAL